VGGTSMLRPIATLDLGALMYTAGQCVLNRSIKEITFIYLEIISLLSLRQYLTG